MEDVSLAYKVSRYEELKAIVEDKVYLVTNTIDDNIYIKKILNKENLNIYKILKEYKNKNRVEVKEYFLYEDKLIVIEEFISGKTLAQILKERCFREDEGIKIINDISNGLIDLHSREIEVIHRDIKPENVMISNDGVVKIIDFDASRIVSDYKENDTVVLGTKGYASPEQFGFAQTDRRSDIYSMGVLLNYMLTKEYPKNKIYEGRLGEIIKKATSIDRENRYKNLEELKEVINRSVSYTNGQGIGYKNLNLKKSIFDEDNNINSANYNIKDKDIKEIDLSEVNEVKGISQRVGFRRKKPLHMGLTIFWYIVAVFGFSQFFVTFNVEDIALALYMIVLPEAVFGNCFGVARKIPIYNKLLAYKEKAARITMFFVLTIICGMFFQ